MYNNSDVDVPCFPFVVHVYFTRKRELDVLVRRNNSFLLSLTSTRNDKIESRFLRRHTLTSD